MTGSLPTLEIIERTRAREPVAPEDVEAFVRAWLAGAVSDAQMAAWCMAVSILGAPGEVAVALTRALIASGDRLELGRLGPTADKHSTGGVGDAVTLVACPLAAALGVRVAKTSGRALGHTGGTLDKLEAIPGMRVDLPLEGFVRQVRDVGIAVTGQSARLVPADRRLYALRDETATVHGAALVASSVMSKKLAGGAGAVVLDVKAGCGAFFADVAEAVEAATLMAEIAGPWGRSVRWLVTAMDQPLAPAVGNALEVAEAARVLRCDARGDLGDLAIRIAGEMAEAAGVAPDGTGTEAAGRALADGGGLKAAERWVEAQGGDPAVWTEPGLLPGARLERPVPAPAAGVVQAVDARQLGEAARWLGAGRLSPGQLLDHGVGVAGLARLGDVVGEGDPLAVVHAQDDWLARRAVEMVRGAYRLGAVAPEPRPLVLAAGPDA